MAKKGKLIPEFLWAKPAWAIRWMRRTTHWGPWGSKIASWICGLKMAGGHFFTYKRWYLNWPAKFGEKPILDFFCTWCGKHRGKSDGK